MEGAAPSTLAGNPLVQAAPLPAKTLGMNGSRAMVTA
jgi:hypothetical protein